MIKWKQHVPAFADNEPIYREFNTVSDFKDFLLDTYNSNGIFAGWDFCYEDNYTKDTGLLMHVNPNRDYWWVLGYVKLNKSQQKQLIRNTACFYLFDEWSENGQKIKMRDNI